MANATRLRSASWPTACSRSKGSPELAGDTIPTLILSSCRDGPREHAIIVREGFLMTTSYHLRPLCTILILAVTLGVGAVDVSAGTNPNFRIVLHAKQSSFEPCNGYLPLDCIANPPTVNVPATPIAVF